MEMWVLELKKWGGGKTTHSVLDGVPARLICISRPNWAKCLYMKASPRVMSSRNEKMKAPSSTYRHWNFSTAVRCGDKYSFGRWPHMRPSPAASLEPMTDLTMQTPIFAFFYLFSIFKQRQTLGTGRALNSSDQPSHNLSGSVNPSDQPSPRPSPSESTNPSKSPSKSANLYDQPSLNLT